jgi:hypothetical protein
MDKTLIEQQVGQQEQFTIRDSDWVALSESDLAVVGGGCAEATPY